MKRIYLDYAATTPVHPRVLQEMQPFFSEKFGNPSSLHFLGQEAKIAVGTARGRVARLIGAWPEEIVFTSGGTEADNFALEGIAYAQEDKGNHIIVSAIEHHAVIKCAKFLQSRGFQVTILPVGGDGLVDPGEVKKSITDKTILVSVMHANNEIGTIQPLPDISKVVKEKGILLHSDAVQTVGHLPFNVDALGADLLSVSAHKLYGPKGVGVLYVRKGTKMISLLHGGAQESGYRASTENVPAIVGLGVAAEVVLEEMLEERTRLIPLRDKLIKGILDKIPDTQLNGHPSLRLPNNVNISFKYIEGEAMILNLDLQGIAASSGSACSSGSTEPSHVLSAIGLAPEVARGSVRFTLGRLVKEEEINFVLEVLPKIVEKLRVMSPLAKK